MVREALRPRLRSLGFRCSGSTFTWPSKVVFAHIGLQKSQFSDRDALKLTENVTVANVAEWERVRQDRPHLPKRPAPNTIYGEFIWQRRIGQLTPEGEDLWWWIHADQECPHNRCHARVFLPHRSERAYLPITAAALIGQ